MANETTELLNVRITQAKNAIRTCADQIATLYQLPATIMELIAEGLVLDYKSIDLSSTVTHYDEIMAQKDGEIKSLTDKLATYSTVASESEAQSTKTSKKK